MAINIYSACILRDELETVKQRAKLRKDELETAKKDLESAERRLEEIRRERGSREVYEENERLKRQLEAVTARVEEIEVANTAWPKVKAEPTRTGSPRRRDTKVEDEASESDESPRSGDGRPRSVSPISERKVLLPARSEGTELPRSSVKRKSESPDRRDEADEGTERSRQAHAAD